MATAARRLSKSKQKDLLPSGHVEVTLRGPAVHVRSLLAGFTSTQDAVWNLTTARKIALVQTLVPTATLDDSLTDRKINMQSPQARVLYASRCIEAAGAIGVSIKQPDFPNAVTATSKIQEVGDALWSAGL
jgi:hypothetical protein